MIIRQAGTGLYASHDEWVKELRDAQDFKDARNAIQYGWCRSLKNVEIHYVYDNPKQNFTTGSVNFP